MIIPRDHINHQQSLPTTMKRFNQKITSWDDGPHQGGGSGGGGGGWIWPQRSYKCSFCKREFRSAQALGGHMNVHRRDRALLKQIVVSNNNVIIDHHPPPSDCGHDHDSCLRVSVPHLSPPTRVSSTYYSQACKISEVKKVISTNDVQVKMSMGLDSSSRRRYGNEKEEEENSLRLFKRCKKSDECEGFAILPFFDELKCSNGKGNPNLKATKSLEGLDLELRLGIV